MATYNGESFYPGQGTQVGMGFTYDQYPWLQNVNPDYRDFAQRLAEYTAPETESQRTRRLIDEYSQYLREIEMAAGSDPRRRAAARAMAMSPQQFAAADAQKRSAKKIEITGAKKTKIESPLVNPFVDVPVEQIGRIPTMSKAATRKARISDVMAGEQKIAAREAAAFGTKARADVQTFQTMVANDEQLRGDPEMAAKIQTGVDAILKGSTPENAMLLIKGAGQAERIKQTRREDAARTARAEAQQYRIELAKMNNAFSMEKMNEAFANQQEIKQQTLEWQAAIENWKANRQDARAQQEAATTAQKLKATFDAKLPGVQKMIAQFQMQINKLESQAPDPGTPEYEKHSAIIENLRSGLQDLQNVKESFMQVPEEVKTRPVAPIAPPAPRVNVGYPKRYYFVDQLGKYQEATINSPEQEAAAKKAGGRLVGT